MEGAIFGALIGGTLGAIIGFTSNIIKSHKTQDRNLGYDWIYVVCDPNLKDALFNLKEFSYVDNNSYYEVGQACDNIVSLWITLNDQNISPQHHWCYKAYQYRRHVEKTLYNMSTKVCMMLKKKQPHGQKLNTSITEFEQCADLVVDIVQNYYCNIMNSMQYKFPISKNE